MGRGTDPQIVNEGRQQQHQHRRGPHLAGLKFVPWFGGGVGRDMNSTHIFPRSNSLTARRPYSQNVFHTVLQSMALKTASPSATGRAVGTSPRPYSSIQVSSLMRKP